MASKGQKLQKFDQSMKIVIVQSHIQDKVSYEVLAKRYGIPRGTITTWVHHYRKHGEVTADKKGRPGPKVEVDYKEKYEILKKFLAFCEKVDRLKK